MNDGGSVIARELKQVSFGTVGLWVVEAVARDNERAALLLSGFKALLAADGALDVTAISGALDAGPVGPVILPVLPAVWVAAEALSTGEDPSAALDRWCDDSVALLDTVRQQRRRLIPVDLIQALAGPAGFLQALNQRCGLNLSTEGLAASAEPASATDVLRNLVASAIVGHHAAAQAMLPEIQAATLAFDVAERAADLASIWNAFVGESRATVGLAGKVKAMGQVLDEQYAKIHQQHLEIERLFLASKAAADKEQAARHEVRDNAKRFTALTADLEQARREVDRVQSAAKRDLRNLQDRLDAHSGEMARVQTAGLAAQEALHEKNAAQGERITAMAAEINRLQARAFVEQAKAEDEIAGLEARVTELSEELRLLAVGKNGQGATTDRDARNRQVGAGQGGKPVHHDRRKD